MHLHSLDLLYLFADADLLRLIEKPIKRDTH